MKWEEIVAQRKKSSFFIDPTQFFREHGSMDDVTDYTVPVACQGLSPYQYLGLGVAYQLFPCKMVPLMLEMFSEEGNYKTTPTAAKRWMHWFVDWSLHFLLPVLLL